MVAEFNLSLLFLDKQKQQMHPIIESIVVKKKNGRSEEERKKEEEELHMNLL